MPYTLKYSSEPEGWDKEGNILSRSKLLELAYELYPKDKNVIIAVGVSDDKELKKVKEVLEKGKYVIITQPDEKTYQLLEKELKEYSNKKIIKDFTFNIGKYLQKESVDYAILLNIINWRPTNLLKMIEGLLKILKSDGYVAISFYVHLNPNAPERKYIINTPQTFSNLLNSLGKFIAYYSDKNGILACYILTKRNLKELYEELLKNYKRLEEERKFYLSN